MTPERRRQVYFVAHHRGISVQAAADLPAIEFVTWLEFYQYGERGEHQGRGKVPHRR